MVHGVVRYPAFDLVIVAPARVHVAVEAREGAARDFDADSMACLKLVASSHWGPHDLGDLARLHPDLLVITVSVPNALDSLIEVVRPPVRINVNQLHCEIGVFDIGRD